MATLTLKVLRELAIHGYSFRVGSEGCTDYVGTDAQMAYDHATDLDEAEIRIVMQGEVKDCILFIPSLDEDEQIADCHATGPVQLVIDTYFE